MITFAEYKDSEKFQKSIKTHLKTFDIDDESKFSDEAIQALIRAAKKGDGVNVIRNSSIVLFPGISLVRMKDSKIENCEIFHTPFTIDSCRLKDNTIRFCHLFQSKNTTLTECRFFGGQVDIEQSNPLFFNFDNGSIYNPKKDKISFFGFVESYQYFMDRLEEYPFCDYKAELDCLILMGVR